MAEERQDVASVRQVQTVAGGGRTFLCNVLGNFSRKALTDLLLAGDRRKGAATPESAPPDTPANHCCIFPVDLGEEAGWLADMPCSRFCISVPLCELPLAVAEG